MARLFVVLLLLWIVWEVVRRVAAQVREAMEPARESRSDPHSLIRCPVCQVHFPGRESSSSSEAPIFCSDGCRQAASSGPS